MRRKKRKRRNTGIFSMFDMFMGSSKVDRIILKEAKKKKQVIYGARAMNRQLPPFLGRLTHDWDIYARRPRRTAHRMQKRLDREVAGGEDDFYAKSAKHKGTHKVMHEGFDRKQRTRDDIGIVDYTEMPRNIRPKRLSGLLWERLSSIKKAKRVILRDPKSRYRHRKEREDLRAIRAKRRMRKV